MPSEVLSICESPDCIPEPLEIYVSVWRKHFFGLGSKKRKSSTLLDPVVMSSLVNLSLSVNGLEDLSDNTMEELVIAKMLLKKILRMRHSLMLSFLPRKYTLSHRQDVHMMGYGSLHFM